jgi:hypothetical protein
MYMYIRSLLPFIDRQPKSKSKHSLADRTPSHVAQKQSTTRSRGVRKKNAKMVFAEKAGLIVCMPAHARSMQDEEKAVTAVTAVWTARSGRM